MDIGIVALAPPPSEAVGREGSVAIFTAQAAAAWTGRGTVTAVSVTAAPKLGDRRAGFDVAKATVAFTLVKDGTAATHLADVTLLEEPDGWKFISIDLRN